MRRLYCEAQTCPIKIMNPFVSTIIAYSTPAVVFAKPIYNSLGADVKNISSITSINNVSLTSIGLILGVVLCGYVTTQERHTHPLLCFAMACGLPGVVVALMAAVA